MRWWINLSFSPINKIHAAQHWHPKNTYCILWLMKSFGLFWKVKLLFRAEPSWKSGLVYGINFSTNDTRKGMKSCVLTRAMVYISGHILSSNLRWWNTVGEWKLMEDATGKPHLREFHRFGKLNTNIKAISPPP